MLTETTEKTFELWNSIEKTLKLLLKRNLEFKFLKCRAKVL